MRSALYQPDLADHVVHVTDLDCVRGCRRLLRREGILAGASSGAVLTALGIQRHLSVGQTARVSPTVAALQVRMGLHTGRAAVGDSGAADERDAVVVGDTVTRAVALQAYAAAGTILCSETTAHCVQRVVLLKAMALGSVDGPATLGRIYKVVGQRKRCAPAVLPTARTGTPFVGRAWELAALHAIWADVTKGQGHVVGVVGEAGIGKSRLVAEFRAGLRHQPHTYVQGHCVSYGQAMAAQPVVTFRRHACGISHGDRPAVMAAKLKSGPMDSPELDRPRDELGLRAALAAVWTHVTTEVAEIDGLVVGVQRLRPIARGVMFYEGLRVASTHRRQGIARAMLRRK